MTRAGGEELQKKADQREEAGSLTGIGQEMQVEIRSTEQVNKSNSGAETKYHKGQSEDWGLYTVWADCLMNLRWAGGQAAGGGQVNHAQGSSGIDKDTQTRREWEHTRNTREGKQKKHKEAGSRKLYVVIGLVHCNSTIYL